MGVGGSTLELGISPKISGQQKLLMNIWDVNNYDGKLFAPI